VNFRTAFLTISTLALIAACTPAAQEPPPATPPPAPIAEAPVAPSGPAAENTADSLSTTPAADPAVPAATPAPATPAAPVAAGPSTAELANGRAVYAGAGSCAMCHGPTGQGTQMGVALTAGLDYDAVKEKITKGMINPGDKMPPMGAALSADQLDDLAKFVAAGLPQ
jgi:mono/diheme cytochrome c family protein